MEKTERMVPRLRFAGFEGSWARKKLADFTTWTSGGTPPKDVAKFWNGEIPWISASTMRGLMYSDSPLKLTEAGVKKGSKLAKQGSLLLLVRGSMLFTKIPIGVANRNLAFNQDVKAIGVNATIAENLYMLYWFISKESQLMEMVTGTGIGAGKLDTDELKNLIIKLPPISEQKKISSFFTDVDNRIATLQKKKSLLEQYKKGMMQKLFSREVRFRDEEFGEWEEKRLGEIADVRRGASPRPITDPKWFDENSKIGWVRISDVTKAKKLLRATEQYLSDEGISKSRLVKKGNLIMSICATIGKPIYTDFDVCIHDGFVVFENLKGVPEFIFYYLEMIQKKWYDYGQPGTQVNLNSEIVNNESVPFPHLKEQTKIAGFLSALDEKIAGVAAQIEKMEKWKKGLLGEMFV
jgi:type I restriction enzyme S subunit